MKRDHRDATVGPWAETKLAALTDYLEYYGLALSKQSFRRVYIDAFAGACLTKVRGTDTSADVATIWDDTADAADQEQFIAGSPVRALGIKHPFHEYYFFDQDETRAAALRDLADGRSDVRIQVGDCNPMIRDLAPKLENRNIRGVAFLDPYGAHLEWGTLEALAKTRTMEVVINFPAAMAINRMITRYAVIPERWSEQLDRCFGTDEWRQVAYAHEPDLFGNQIVSKKERVSELLLDLYVRRLKELFGYVATPRLIRNTRHTPLYYLIWAGPHGLGLKGADYILRQGERVAKAR